MVEYYVFEEQLRNLVRRADSAGYTRQGVFEALIELADQYREKAEALELEQIIADQLDPSNPRYDYGLA
jgi:hypothetical protein